MSLYDTIRDLDILLLEGRGPISSAIQMKQEYSHAAICLRLRYPTGNNDLIVTEAVSGGIKMRHLGDKLGNGVRGYFYIPDAITDEQRARGHEWAMKKKLELELHPSGYDLGALFRNICGYAPFNESKYFCSEWVWAVWFHAGFAWRTDFAPRPDDLLEMVPGRLIPI